MNKNKTLQICIAFAGAAIIGLLIFAYLKAKAPTDELKDVSIVTAEQTAETMTVTVKASCPCAICNGQWPGMVFTGQTINSFTEQGKNICAVDPAVITIGSKVIYDDKEYIAADIGSAIKGKIIVILLNTHKETEEFGIKENQVVLIKK